MQFANCGNVELRRWAQEVEEFQKRFSVSVLRRCGSTVGAGYLECVSKIQVRVILPPFSCPLSSYTSLVSSFHHDSRKLAQLGGKSWLLLLATKTNMSTYKSISRILDQTLFTDRLLEPKPSSSLSDLPLDPYSSPDSYHGIEHSERKQIRYQFLFNPYPNPSSHPLTSFSAPLSSPLYPLYLISPQKTYSPPPRHDFRPLTMFSSLASLFLEAIQPSSRKMTLSFDPNSLLWILDYYTSPTALKL